MKKLIFTLALMVATLSASANAVRYFTRPQATRIATTLDAQNELMIYCGYEYELATYVLVNEVWMEPVNSKYYEIWLYGFDAYTGEEIYMPIDLSCIWLYNAYGNRMYSAAQFLRFRSTVSTPNFYWTMPPYNPFTRRYHDPRFNHGYTYHYDIHRHGWRPPHVAHGHPAPLPPYYMRTPNTPAPVPTKPYTPGVDHPNTNGNYSYSGGDRSNYGGTRNTIGTSNGGSRSGTNSRNEGNTGTTSRSSAPSNASGTGNSRNNNATGTGTNTTSGRNNNATGTGSNTTTGRNSNATGTSNSRNNNTTGTGSNTTTGRSSNATGSSNSRNNNTTSTKSGSSNTSRSSATTTGNSRSSSVTSSNSSTSAKDDTKSTGRSSNTGSSNNGRNNNATGSGSNSNRR